MSDKKAEFRKYLEESGVMDNIVKSLVLLYQEDPKPADPLAFVANKLGATTEAGTGGGCEEQNKKITELTTEVEELKTKLGIEKPDAAEEPKPEEDSAATEEVEGEHE